MSNQKQLMLERAGIVLFALPSLIWFPMGFSLVIVSADQLLFGFDDMPLGLTVFSFVVGICVAVYSMWVIGRGVRRGTLRLPVFLTVSAVFFGAISLPAARFMTRVEQERRYAAELQTNSILHSGTYQIQLAEQGDARQSTTRCELEIDRTLESLTLKSAALPVVDTWS